MNGRDMGVYKRVDRWYLDYYLPNGQRVRERVTIKGVDPSRITKKLALASLSIRKAELAEGKFDIVQTRKQVLFDKAVKSFIEDYSKIHKKSWTRDVTSSRALQSYFGGKRISSINTWLVNKYRSRRLNEVAKATINRELAFLKTMLNFAVQRNWLSTNPLKGYKRFPEPPKTRIVTKEEFRAVYGEASDFLKPILLMAVNTGMRRGEIFDLKWSNVNLAEGYLLVEDSKNNESRHITINKQLNEALKSVKYHASGDYVFSHGGSRVKTFKTAFNAAIRRAGVKPFRFHDLRHTFASNLVMKGVDLVTVGELLGHKSLSMTRRYSHPSPEHKKQAVEKLDFDISVTKTDKDETEIKTKRS